MTKRVPKKTMPLLRCCERSLREQVHLANEDGDKTTCTYSAGDGFDEHRLLRVDGEWRRRAR